MKIDVAIGLLTIQLAVLSYAAQSAQAAPSSSWTMDQFCQPYGRVRFSAAPSGAKLDSAKLSVVMSPSAATRVFNQSKKTYCELSDATSRSKLSFTTTPGAPVKGSTSKILNMNATQWWCGGFNSKGKMVFTSELWTTKDIGIPQYASDKYLKLLGLPQGLGTPLRVFRHFGDVRDPRHRTRTFLETYKAEPAKLGATALAAPSGYSKADELTVIMGDELDELSALGGK